jgi:ribonuclease P protein component
VTKFRPVERIRRRVEFQRVYELGARFPGRYSTIFVLGNDAGHGRLGIAATRKLGGAVLRNRAKRLIREVFRRNKLTQGLDVVVVPKRGLIDAGLIALEREYNSIIERQLGRAGRTGRVARL